MPPTRKYGSALPSRQKTKGRPCCGLTFLTKPRDGTGFSTLFNYQAHAHVDVEWNKVLH